MKMSTSMRSLAVAALALACTLGASQASRAEEGEALAAPAQDMVLVSAKSIEALEQRVIYLEETVASLTDAWQHIDTHRICVSDATGSTETCLTKPELDALLVNKAAPAEAAPTTTTAADAGGPPAITPVESVAAAEPAEPASAEVANAAPQDEPEQTGSIASLHPAVEPEGLPKPEIDPPGDIP
jgi:hypothetical protein